MRLFVIAALLYGVAASPLFAQGPPLLHEIRTELFVTSPRVDGFGVTLVVEQHLAAGDLAPNERVLGLGVVSPVVHGVSVGSEVRQVLTPAALEHRYVQTIVATIPFFAGFAIRDRTRIEFRDIGATWSRRYQNRAAFGHDIDVLGRSSFPYIQADLSYDTRYSSLNRREATLGIRTKLLVGVNVDTYVTRQSDSRRTPLLLLAGGTIVRVAL